MNLLASVTTTATTAGGVVPIGWFQLVLASLFMVVTGAISVALSLGMVKDLAFATVRTYLQLHRLGLVLRWVFANDAWWIVRHPAAASWWPWPRASSSSASPDAPRGLSSAARLVSMVVTGVIVSRSR